MDLDGYFTHIISAHSFVLDSTVSFFLKLLIESVNTKQLAFGWQYQSRCSVLTFGYVRKEEARPIDSVYVQLIDMLVCYKALRCLRKEKRLAPKYSEFPIFEKKVNIFNLKIGQWNIFIFSEHFFSRLNLALSQNIFLAQKRDDFVLF